MSGDETRALSGSLDKTLKVWDLATGRLLRTLEGHASRVRAVAMSGDGTRALSGSDDKTLKVWDLATGGVVATFAADYPLLCYASSPRAETLVAGDSSGRVHLLRLENL
jgi:WD40 repeat protein